MFRPLKLMGGLFALVVLLAAALYAYRNLMLFEGRTPEGYEILTPTAAASFEPQSLPTRPALANMSAQDLEIGFGYKVGDIPYSYLLTLAFPGPGDTGRATLAVHHGAREASVATDAVRRWDAPRKAYAVALQARFEIEPAVPALCIKTVIGPKPTGYDLQNASICVAQRDVTGACHPETLACGAIHP